MQSPPDQVKKENHVQNVPGENAFLNMAKSFIPGKRKVEDQPLAEASAEIKRLRSLIDKEIKARMKLEKLLRSAEFQIIKMGDELDEERFHKRKQNEELHRMAHEKRNIETEAMKKANQLNEKIFELTGGTFDATHDQLRGMLQAWLGSVGDMAPKFFTSVEHINFEDPAHLQHFKQNLEEWDFVVLRKYKSDVYYYLCESWLFKSVIQHIMNVFCVGTRELFEAFGQNDNPVDKTTGQKVDEGLWLLYDKVENLPEDAIPG
jgi:hypothetical protein